MLEKHFGLILTVVAVLFFAGLLAWMIPMSIEEGRLEDEQEAQELVEAEQRCNAYAGGEEWFLDFEHQWGSDEWVCTFITSEGPEQIRWPE